MKLYKEKNNSLKSLINHSFKVEKEIQSLVENNINELFGLEFVATEFTIENFRIDTLCYDKFNNSFVLVEYKNGNSYSVIDQGFTYLSMLLNNKAEFVLAYNERSSENLKKDAIDWSSSRVIFISPAFNSYQKNSVNFKDVPFELWEIRKFDGGLIGLEQISANSNESIAKLTGKSDNSLIKQVSSQIKVVSVSDHEQKSDEKTVTLWELLQDEFNSLPDVSIYATKHYVGIKRGANLVCSVRFMKNHLSLLVTRGTISQDGNKSKNFFSWDDPYKISVEKNLELFQDIDWA